MKDKIKTNTVFRIGNLLASTWNGKYEIGAVTGISDHDFSIEIDEVGYVIDDYSPILITEEWLINLGFEHYKTDKSNVYKSGIFMFVYTFDGRFKGKRMVTLANALTLDENNIKYVHQLQNLYFALTGEELKTQEHE